MTGGLFSSMHLTFKANLDQNGNVIVDENYMSSIEGVFSAGDMIMGASLVVRAIHQGRAAARAIDKFLMGETCLP